MFDFWPVDISWRRQPFCPVAALMESSLIRQLELLKNAAVEISALSFNVGKTSVEDQLLSLTDSAHHI